LFIFYNQQLKQVLSLPPDANGFNRELANFSTGKDTSASFEVSLWKLKQSTCQI